MHRQSKEKKKRKIIAVVLIMLMIFTVAMPTSAMSGMEETMEQSDTQQEVAEESKNSEVQDTEENISELEIGEETEEISVENPEDNEEEQFVGEAESENQDETTVDETSESDFFSSDEQEEQSADVQDADTNENAAVTFAADTVEAPDVVGSINTANEWQIVSEEYSGREQINKKGYDIDNDGIDDVYYQKNVIPTGVENEFRVYLGITKKMSWDELLAESALE